MCDVESVFRNMSVKFVCVIVSAPCCVLCLISPPTPALPPFSNARKMHFDSSMTCEVSTIFHTCHGGHQSFGHSIKAKIVKPTVYWGDRTCWRDGQQMIWLKRATHRLWGTYYKGGPNATSNILKINQIDVIFFSRMLGSYSIYIYIDSWSVDRAEWWRWIAAGVTTNRVAFEKNCCLLEVFLQEFC